MTWRFEIEGEIDRTTLEYTILANGTKIVHDDTLLESYSVDGAFTAGTLIRNRHSGEVAFVISGDRAVFPDGQVLDIKSRDVWEPVEP